jgi:curli biogenesis system outer membrane secretion channel CsgG
MRKYIFLIVLCLSLLAAAQVFAAEKPRIGVLRFTNHTHAGWWGYTSGTELQDMLIAELASTKAFRVLERQELDKVLSEQKLSESGLVEESTRLKPGRIKVAQYLVASTVSAFQEDTSGSDSGISIYGFHVGGAKKTAYMAVDLKVIDTQTGEIVNNRTVEATSEGGGFSLSGSLGGILSGNLGKQEKTPVGKAIRACVIEIAAYLECSMTKPGDECIKKYEEKEKKRKDKTGKSIKLDE